VVVTALFLSQPLVHNGYVCKKKIEPSRPWAGLQIQMLQDAMALFTVATELLVGNGLHS
jgi:hypothetical protein